MQIMPDKSELYIYIPVTTAMFNRIQKRLGMYAQQSIVINMQSLYYRLPVDNM